MSILETKNCEDTCSKVKDKNYEDALERVKVEINRMGIKCYTSVVLNQLTSNLSATRIVGRGGYGVVYHGKFPNSGEQVAIKMLENKDIVEESETFMAEVRTMGHTSHRNLIKLKGYCFEPHMKALVYEFMEKGSLDNILYKPDASVKWEKLYDIAVEIAHGLMYLHEGSSEQIIHYDIKAGNVLLDNNFSPKIGDFGLAKLIKRDVRGVPLSGRRGTDGYTAPELYTHGFSSIVTNKCDVYSFGMLLFEILGKRNINVQEQGEYFPKQVWFSFDSGKLEQLLDNIPITKENRENANILSKVALLCIQNHPEDRPTMKEVWLMLDKEKQVQRKPLLPSLLWQPWTSSTTSSKSSYQLSDDDFSGTSGSNNERGCFYSTSSMTSSLELTSETNNQISDADINGTCGSNERSNQDPESISSSLKDKTPESTVSVVQQETQVIYQPIPMEGLDEGKKKKFTFENGAIYEGTWKNGLRHGKGKMLWTNGNKYEGEFKDGSLDGLGKYTYEDGDWYEGAYKNGNREGKGIFSFVNGNVYEGEYKKGKRDGRGTFLWKNGSKYIGDYKNGIREGKGEYYLANGNKYIGEYKNDGKDGCGTFLWKNGDVYDGEFRNDKKEGRGTYLWKNGDKYIGDYKNGIREGRGELYLVNGNKYVGEFKNDKKHGRGTYLWKNGDKYIGDYKNGNREGKGELVLANGNKYIGEFKNDVKDGRGTYIWIDGQKYIGDYKNGNREGKGEHSWANGDVYDGEFRNDKKEGHGTYLWENGDKYIGDYKNGIREGKGELYLVNGNKYIGEFKNNKKHGRGTYLWKNGDKYIGDYKDGNKDGHGKFTYKNGSNYEGTYQNDFKHGKGIFVKANGEERSGEWIKGIEQ